MNVNISSFKALWVVLALIIGITLLTTSSYASTCPTVFKQGPQGYWHSIEEPGFRSHQSTKPGITISATDFGGAVYSPKHQRIACVYKASNDKWIAFVSNHNQNIKINQPIQSSHGETAWQYSPTHKDYTCGKPRVSDLSKCEFQIE